MIDKNVQKNSGKTTPTVLCILDGFGLAEPGVGNAIDAQSAPYIFSLMDTYPSTKLKAHGEAVGLFAGQSGNSESGHFAIGAGRVVEQDLVRISHAIKDKTFFDNSAFEKALVHADEFDSSIHVLGLLTDNESPHARPDHLYALLQFLREQGHGEIFLHLFTDGRDAPPHSAVQFLKDLRAELQPHEKIASISGRFYAMDRNKNWERTSIAYDAMACGVSKFTAESAEEAIAHAYNRSETDEYIQPTIITDNGKPITQIKDNDIVYFFNARSDRARQLTKALVQTETFTDHNPWAFERKCIPKNLHFVAMTDFGPDLPGVLNAFPSPDIAHCLAAAIGEERKQLFISESEKYAHVTFFMNGGFPKPINGEIRRLVPSKNVYTFADKPEMESEEITNQVIQAITTEGFDFVCVNFPNADMVGHTGNVDAARKAVNAVDRSIARITEAVLELNGTCIITADHGNAEEMLTVKTGEMITQHSIHPVPFILINDAYIKRTLREGGGLADVSPTLLDVLDIEAPVEMTGVSLLKNNN